MKVKLSLCIVFSMSICLIGCQNPSNVNNDKPIVTEEFHDKSEGDIMDELDFFDFENIGMAPNATEKQPPDNVIKIFFGEWTFDSPYEPVAINLQTNEIYTNPSISSFGFSFYDKAIEIKDSTAVLQILKNYNVQNWKNDYTFEDPNSYEDGYSWELWLQFEDGTVAKHGGAGTDVDKLTPEHFHAFAKELKNFVNEQLESATQ